MNTLGKNVDTKIRTITNSMTSEEDIEVVNTVSSVIETMGESVDGLTSSDVLSIVGSSMEILSVITPLIPVVGPLVSAVFGLLGSIFGAIGGTEDTGSIVKKVIEEALNNYDDSELRAETAGTMRVYRISQAYLNSEVNITIKKHELSALAANVPVYSGIKFLGDLSQKITENSEKHDKTQVLRAAEYTQMYVTLAVMRSTILWKMYSLVRQAPDSEFTASAIKRVVQAEHDHDKDFLQFIAKPVYSKAVFFAYFSISDWPVLKKYMNKIGLQFQQSIDSKPHYLYEDTYKDRYLALIKGSVFVNSGLTENTKFNFLPISAENKVYYIRSAEYSNAYIYVDDQADISTHPPGNEGKFKITRFDDGKYLISTIESPDNFFCVLPVDVVYTHYPVWELHLVRCRWVIV